MNRSEMELKYRHNPLVKTFYEYAIEHGWNRFQGIYEPKPWCDGYSQHDSSWRYSEMKRATDTENWIMRREELYSQYERLISTGEIRKPTRKEELISIAMGHPDNESVQAAKRILRKNSRKERSLYVRCEQR